VLYVDLNNDGCLTYNDFLWAKDKLCYMSGWKIDSPKYRITEALFTEIWRSLERIADVDQDGKITKTEWLAMWTEYKKEIVCNVKENKNFLRGYYRASRRAHEKEFPPHGTPLGETEEDPQKIPSSTATVTPSYDVNFKLNQPVNESEVSPVNNTHDDSIPVILDSDEEDIPPVDRPESPRSKDVANNVDEVQRNGIPPDSEESNLRKAASVPVLGHLFGLFAKKPKPPSSVVGNGDVSASVATLETKIDMDEDSADSLDEEESEEEKSPTTLDMFADHETDYSSTILPKWLFKYLVFRFNLLDRCGDNVIDVEEFSYVLSEFECSEKTAKQAFLIFTQNNTVKLDFEYFVHLFEEYYLSDDPSDLGNFINGRLRFEDDVAPAQGGDDEDVDPGLLDHRKHSSSSVHSMDDDLNQSHQVAASKLQNGHGSTIKLHDEAGGSCSWTAVKERVLERCCVI